jgi:hypothetical protein
MKAIHSVVRVVYRRMRGMIGLIAFRIPHSAFRIPQLEPSAPARHSAPTPVVAAPSVSPIVAIPSVSESEPPVATPSVSESGPRPAPVPSTVAGVMPVDEFSSLLIVEAPASLLGESLAGQRQIDDNRQCGNQQGEPQRSQFEHRRSPCLKL